MKHPVPVTFFIPYGAKYRELRKENIDVSNIQTVFVQIIRKPERLCIIRRGRKAEDYFPYCEEVSCDVWGILTSMRSLCGEPVSMWLPQAVSTMREYKILKRLRVTPVSPVFILGVELTMYTSTARCRSRCWPYRLRFSGMSACAARCCVSSAAARDAEDRQPLPADAGHYDDEERLHRRGYG